MEQNDEKYFKIYKPTVYISSALVLIILFLVWFKPWGPKYTGNDDEVAKIEQKIDSLQKLNVESMKRVSELEDSAQIHISRIKDLDSKYDSVVTKFNKYKNEKDKAVNGVRNLNNDELVEFFTKYLESKKR